MFNKDFFPTPTHVLDMMQIDCNDKITLEPQAGKGNIVEYLKTNGAKEVLSCENNRDLAEIVKGGWPLIKKGKMLSKGIKDAPRIKNVREHLSILGELTNNQVIATDTFDITLENAVKQFQAKHELDTTGIVDNRTIGELNIPVAERIHQIEINMERWKSIPLKFEKEYLFANIAANRLDVIEDNVIAMTMKIIVGRFYRKTPIFNAELSYIEFNPYWIVPPGIMKNDIIPKIKKDTSFIKENDMYVVKDDKKINYAEVNWDMADSTLSHYKIIQNPGPNNPLGVVEFAFPNPYFVYMHDTPSKNLFEVPSPAFSSGCIRLSKAVNMAKYILEKDKKWKADKIDSLINTGKNVRVSIDKPIKVYIAYFTAWVSKEGILQFAPDIYKRDY